MFHVHQWFLQLTACQSRGPLLLSDLATCTMIHSYRTPASHSGCSWPSTNQVLKSYFLIYFLTDLCQSKERMMISTAESERSALPSELKGHMRYFASVVFKRPHVVLKYVSQVNHWSLGQVEKYNRPRSNCTKGWLADGGLLVHFHKHAETTAWHQRNNVRSSKIVSALWNPVTKEKYNREEKPLLMSSLQPHTWLL